MPLLFSVGAACGRPGVFRRLRTASFFLSDQKETKESPGVSFVGKALRLRLALSLTIPPDPRFTGEPEGYLGNPDRRGALLNSV